MAPSIRVAVARNLLKNVLNAAQGSAQFGLGIEQTRKPSMRVNDTRLDVPREIFERISNFFCTMKKAGHRTGWVYPFGCGIDPDHRRRLKVKHDCHGAVRGAVPLAPVSAYDSYQEVGWGPAKY